MYEMELEMVCKDKGFESDISTMDRKLNFYWECMSESEMLEIVKQNPKFGSVKEYIALLHPPPI